MCRLIETICVIDGVIQHLEDHQLRLERSVFHLFGSKEPPILADHLRVPEEFTVGRIKCRVVYHHRIEEITWQPYQIRPVASIGLIHHKNPNYAWKFEDRSLFSECIRTAQMDDIIIVRDGFLTDASYANILLKSGPAWFTPEKPLLAGTQRKRLLDSGKIIAVPIRVEDLPRYEGIKYINAMLDMDFSPEMPMETIRII